MNRDDEARDEARRIINRVDLESEPTMLGRARHHMAGDDADQSDWAELWGTRIGRWAGVILLIYLIWWLIDFAIYAG
ncbi:hypothetical protein [Aquamicrobium zhengzhouense]|uniref:Uncharacterized protein n=1 Tax=Aquamicrobium zhengzhouense TaxID=2781738 RepID=A0ABS0SFI4_9HYPH|nr:hypothetical protein [Aquamicrobium zhengzhouense]MBI1622063.1 hypothetical protein [Aquamicrobium zhengzhouense]